MNYTHSLSLSNLPASTLIDMSSDAATNTTEPQRDSDTLMSCMLNYYTERYHAQRDEIERIRGLYSRVVANNRRLTAEHQVQRDAFDFLALQHDMLVGMYTELRAWADQAVATCPEPQRARIAALLRNMEGHDHPLGAAENPIDLTADEDL